MINKKKSLIGALIVTVIAGVHAKQQKGEIMTVDGEGVPTEEFLYLFQKNREQQSQPQSLDEYLQLFEIYRLKVAAAKSEGIDTTEAFRNEMNLYKRELLEPYLADSTFFRTLVDIAAQREKEMVESSHIMIIRTHDQAKDSTNLVLLDSLRTEIINGADFIELAKAYSQDKFSSDKGGYLGFSPAGTYPYAFETAVYETPEGEVSEIVESHVGWHIVKAGARKPSQTEGKTPKSYEDIEAEVARKSSSPFDARYHQIRDRRMEKLRAKHKDVSIEGLNKEDAYNKLLEAEEEYQYTHNSDYRNLVDEYVNGSLLYEVSVENIWDKASNDQAGLEAFYKANKEKYIWDKPHAKGIMVQVLNDSIGNLIKTGVEGLPSDSIIPYITKTYKKKAKAEKFNVPEGVNAMVDYKMFNGPEAAPRIKNSGDYFVLQGEIIETPQNLDDVRTEVIADYQELLEKEWVKDLRHHHSVIINEKELKNLRKQLKE